MWPTDQHQVLLVTLKDNSKREKSTIPPILHNNKYVTDFKEKSELFNSFFANQCSLIPNKSILTYEIMLLREHTLTSCHFYETENLQIINSQDSNEAHGRDMISIHMLKLCGEAIF